MASDGNFAATPYPVYDTGRGDDDSVQTAVLVSHAGAAVERNQDAGFSSLRAQIVNRDVLSAARNTEVSALTAVKDSEIRAADRLSDVKAELAALRSEMFSRDIASLRAEVQDTKAAAANGQLIELLKQILAKP